MATKNLTASVKAMINEMSTLKNTSNSIMHEYRIASTNTRIGVIGQAELKAMYDRYGESSGCSKATHLHNVVNGDAFHYIVVKRMKKHCIKWLKNQAHAEIEMFDICYQNNDTDCICPIVKSYETKSDHNNPESDKAYENIIIIAQKAVYVSNAKNACIKAEELNAIETERHIDYTNCEDAGTRYKKLEAWSNKYDMNDCLSNGGNTGVIYDYAKHCYKAVFIDYAL